MDLNKYYVKNRKNLKLNYARYNRNLYFYVPLRTPIFVLVCPQKVPKNKIEYVASTP